MSTIGVGAFSGCTNLTSVNLGSNAIVSASRTYNTSLKSIFGDQVKTYVIGKSVKGIGQYAFYGCTGLTSITIGTAVLSIGSEAFSNTSPKKVIWLTNTPPEGYRNIKGTINYTANEQYSGLTNVMVYPFISSLFEVNGVKYVPVSPSERTCDAIDCVHNKSVENLNIGETVTNRGIKLTIKQINPYLCYGNTFVKDANLSFTGNIGAYAFYGCTGLNESMITNQGSIGSEAFSGCIAMQTAELGQGITSIGSNAFKNCSMLGSIVIPDAVTFIPNRSLGFLGVVRQREIL